VPWYSPPGTACAALLPDLVTAAASLASPAPYDAEGLDWLAGLDWQARTPGVDLALITGEVVSIQQALAPGIEGSWDDCVAQLTSWGFDAAQISIPVLLLHGGQDQAVPFSHGQWLRS
jgi:pimeloyl-ACP methyl ester carboxylesterase